MYFMATCIIVIALIASVLALPSPHLIGDRNSAIESRQTASFKDDVLNQHSTQRSHYGAEPLTWSNALYPATQQWADACKFQHSGGSYGENLAAGTGSFGISEAMGLWMDEASKYDYDKPGFSPETGHFTQVVWKNTKQVACAVANCRAGTIFPDPSVYVVCRYSPAGNIRGQFPQNVGRPT